MSSSPDEKRQITHPKSVDISSINRELDDLWAAEARRVTGQNEPPIAKVCTVNLLVYTKKTDDLEKAKDIIDKATNNHPLKVIMILAEDEEAGRSSSSEISGYCRLVEGGGIQICCEQITLSASGSQVLEIVSSASELLSPDLPVALWWIGDIDISNDSFKQLESVSDRLISDTLNIRKPIESMRQMAHLATGHLNTALSDLNWLRITPWREVIADLFDPREMRSYLYDVSSLHIKYAPGDTLNLCQSSMIAGWMQNLLQWNIVSSSYDADTGRVDAQLISIADKGIDIVIEPAVTDNVQPGYPVSIMLKYNSGHTESLISYDSEKPFFDIESKTDGVLISRRDFRYKAESTGEMLAEELTSMSADPVYYGSLTAGYNLITRKTNVKNLGNTIW